MSLQDNILRDAGLLGAEQEKTPGLSGTNPVEGFTTRGTSAGELVRLGPLAGALRRKEGLAPSPAGGRGLSRGLLAYAAGRFGVPS